MMFKIIAFVIFNICLFKQAELKKIECAIQGVEIDNPWSSYQYYTNKKINDTHFGVVHATTTTNVTAIRFEGAEYLEIDFKNNKLTISTTQKFKEYEKNEKNTTIIQVLVIECGEEKYSLEYRQPLIDINSHTPEFNQDGYIYSVYGELKEDFILTNLLTIIANDMDITDTDLDYSIKAVNDDHNRDLYIYEYSSDLSIQVVKTLTPPYKEQFYLTAKDSRSVGPSKNATVILSVELIAPEEEFDFVSKSYTASIVGKELILEDAIGLVGGIDRDVEFTFSEYDFGSFKASVNYIKGSINIKYTNKQRINRETTDSFNLKMYATWKGKSAETDIEVKAIDAICEIENINLDNSYYYNPSRINDTHKGMIQTFKKMRNIKNIACMESKYLKCSFDDAKGFQVLTTDLFPSYEEFENSDETSINVTVQCVNEVKTFEYRQRITDVNTHPPKFNSERYEYIIHNGIRKDLSLTNILPISASDLDMTTGRLYFAIEESDDFTVSTSVYEDDKIYRPSLHTKQTIMPPYNKEFKLIVRDMSNAEISLSSTAVIKIELMEAEDGIEFTKTSYEATVSENNIIIPKDLITLKTGVDRDVNITITTDKYFGKISPVIDVIRNAIDLQIDRKSRGVFDTGNTITMTLYAEWNGRYAGTEVVVNSEFAKCKIGNLDWAKVYTNPEKIDDTFSGTIQEFKETLNINDIKCTDSKYLDCSYIDGIFKVFTLPSFKDFEEHETKAVTSVNVTVQCKKETIVFEYLQKINDINNHAPTFLQDKYEYILYNQIPNNIDLTDILRIEAIDKDVTNQLKFSLASSKSNNNIKYFSDYDKDGKLYFPILEIQKTLQGPLNEAYEIFVTDGENNATASINIQIINENNLKFEKTKYYGHLENENIVLDDFIRMENGFDKSITVNISEEYENYIKLSPTQIKNAIEIDVKKSLEELNETSIEITLQAFWKTETATSILELQLDSAVTKTTSSTESNTEHPTTTSTESNTEHPTTTSTESNTEHPPTSSTESNTEHPPTSSTESNTEHPTKASTEPQLESTTWSSMRTQEEDEMLGFKNWLLIGNVAQITVFAAAGATIIGLLYASRSLCYTSL